MKEQDKIKDFKIQWTVFTMIFLACVSACAIYTFKNNSVGLAIFTFSTVFISLVCRTALPKSENGLIRVGRCLSDVAAVVLVISEFAKIPGTEYLSTYIWALIFMVIFACQTILMYREFS